MSPWATEGGLGLQPTPKRKQESLGATPIQALVGASSWDWGSLPILCLGQALTQPLPALSLGRACPCPSTPLQHWVGWPRPLLVSGTPGGAPGSRNCMCWSGGRVGRVAGQGCRGGNSSPGEPKTGSCLTPGATPEPVHPALPSGAACCFSFTLTPPLPCPALLFSRPNYNLLTVFS